MPKWRLLTSHLRLPPVSEATRLACADGGDETLRLTLLEWGETTGIWDKSRHAWTSRESGVRSTARTIAVIWRGSTQLASHRFQCLAVAERYACEPLLHLGQTLGVVSPSGLTLFWQPTSSARHGVSERLSGNLPEKGRTYPEREGKLGHDMRQSDCLAIDWLHTNEV